MVAAALLARLWHKDVQVKEFINQKNGKEHGYYNLIYFLPVERLCLLLAILEMY